MSRSGSTRVACLWVPRFPIVVAQRLERVCVVALLACGQKLDELVHRHREDVVLDVVSEDVDVVLVVSEDDVVEDDVVEDEVDAVSVSEDDEESVADLLRVTAGDAVLVSASAAESGVDGRSGT